MFFYICVPVFHHRPVLSILVFHFTKTLAVPKPEMNVDEKIEGKAIGNW